MEGLIARLHMKHPLIVFADVSVHHIGSIAALLKLWSAGEETGGHFHC